MTKEQRAKARFAIDCIASALHAEEYGLPDADCRKAITQASYVLDDVISQLGGKRAEIVPFPAAASAADESMPDDSTDEDSKKITGSALADECAVDNEVVRDWCQKNAVGRYGRGYLLTEAQASAFKRDIGWEK